MKLIETISEPFNCPLKEVELYLRDHGWRPFHAGAWRNPQRPGVSREIRRPGNAHFIIVESEYKSSK